MAAVAGPGVVPNIKTEDVIDISAGDFAPVPLLVQVFDFGYVLHGNTHV